jgi:hypothetical protein
VLIFTGYTYSQFEEDLDLSEFKDNLISIEKVFGSDYNADQFYESLVEPPIYNDLFSVRGKEA